MGIGICSTPGAKLDIYRPQLTNMATPIGLQVINNDVSTVTTPFPPTDINTQTSIGVNASVINGNSNVTIGGEFNSSDAKWLSIGSYSAATCSSSLTGNGAIGGLFEATATSPTAGISNGIISSASGPYLNNGIRAESMNGIENIGVGGSAIGPSGSTNYGIYAVASGGSINYAGYFGGDIYCSGSYLPSDEKLKTNLTNYTDAMSRLRSIKTHTYIYLNEQYKEMNLSEGKQTGFLANEFSKSFPELTKETKFFYKDKTKEPISYKAVNYTGLIPYLVEAIQELDAKVEENKSLAQQVASLQSQLNDICNSGCAALKGNSNCSDQSSTSDNKLLQNVPNPFSQLTTIGYVLNTGNVAYINVNSLDGKIIKHIELSAKGQGSVVINGSELNPGTYTYSLYTDGNVVDTKLMVIAAKN